MGYEITPIEERGGLLLKREDLFAPYGSGDVNGGKLRQCHSLISEVKPEGVVTACSIYSPQAAITAAVAEEFGIPCVIFYGGTTSEKLRTLPMPRLALKHKAKIAIAARTGRHNVLYKAARDFAKKKGYFVVDYGFNVTQYPKIMYGAVSSQVSNVPEVERVAITCGSGITTVGVLRGLDFFDVKPKELHLFCTAPDRSKMVEGEKRGIKVYYHDLFHEDGFVYEKEEPMRFCGVELHPNYEAKAMRRFIAEGIEREGTLFWIVGAKPTK